MGFLLFTYQLPTGIALLPPGILHEAVSKDHLPVHKQLVHAVLLGAALLMQAPGGVLGYLRLLLSSNSTKPVKLMSNHF